MWKQTKDIAHMVQIIKHGLFLLLHIDLCNSDGCSRFILGTKMAR